MRASATRRVGVLAGVTAGLALLGSSLAGIAALDEQLAADATVLAQRDRASVLEARRAGFCDRVMVPRSEEDA